MDRKILQQIVVLKKDYVEYDLPLDFPCRRHLHHSSVHCTDPVPQ